MIRILRIAFRDRRDAAAMAAATVLIAAGLIAALAWSAP